MSDVIDITERKVDREFASRLSQVKVKVTGSYLKQRREDLKILRRQLAQQIRVSIGTIERWELSPYAPLSEDELEFALAQIRLDDKSFLDGRNLCFGRTPIRLAREMLDMTQSEAAAKYDLSLNMWKKIENHERKLNPKIIQQFENEIRMIFVGTC